MADLMVGTPCGFILVDTKKTTTTCCDGTASFSHVLTTATNRTATNQNIVVGVILHAKVCDCECTCK